MRCGEQRAQRVVQGVNQGVDGGGVHGAIVRDWASLGGRASKAAPLQSRRSRKPA
jgi:hypothetical protein